jgi:DNA-binding NarL/FixJ family response regulator
VHWVPNLAFSAARGRNPETRVDCRAVGVDASERHDERPEALLEREGELSALRDAIERAKRAEGSVVMITGTAGIGKTALLHAAEEEAIDSHLQVLVARAGELEQEFPYGVMRQLFEPRLRESGPRERAALLAGPAHPAGALLGGELAGIPGDGSALDHAFYWLLANLAEQRPLVVAVDDGHWADVASLRALVYLARRRADLPVVVMIATRPLGDGPRRALVERLSAEARRTLEPAALSDEGVGTLIHRRLVAADDAFCHACRVASGGNPFLVGELISAVHASGLDPVDSNAGRVRSIGPRNVMRSVLLRLESLRPEATSVARALAVLGEAPRLPTVAGLSEVDERLTAVAVDELRLMDIVASDGPLRFVHSIVRAAVYDDLPAAERSLQHGQAARLLAAEDASTDAVAAHLLLTRPGTDRWTVESLVRAASTGMAMSAPETVAAYLERALLEAVPGVDRAALLMFLGGARFQTLAGGAVEPLSEALAASKDAPARMEAARALASALMTERRYHEAWELVERTIEELAECPDVAGEMELFSAMRLYADLQGAADATRRVARWQPDPAGATRLDRSMLVLKGWAAMIVAKPAAESARPARTALSTGTLVVDDTWYVTFDMAVWTLIASGCYDEALTHLEHAATSLRSMGRLLREATLLPICSELHRRCGRLQLAEEAARGAVEIIPHEQVYAPHSASALAIVLADQGQLSEARQTLSEHGYEQEIPDGGLADILWFARGRLRIAEGDLAGGIDDLLRYGEISEMARRRNPGYWPWRSTAAEALAQSGRREEAITLAGEELQLARRTGQRALEGPALLSLGVAHAGGQGIQLLTEAVDALADSPRVLDHTRAQLALGTALRLDGKRTQSRGPLRATLETATHIGARPIAERAHGELLASGARPRRTALRGIDALTPSERRVASLAAQGLTNRQIAQTLYVTAKTIEAHLRNTYDKLEIPGKAELARVFDASPESAPIDTV